jgi:hypothetical protein
MMDVPEAADAIRAGNATYVTDLLKTKK